MPLRKSLPARAKGKGKSKSGALVFVTLIPVISFVVGSITKGYTLYDGFATKTYLEMRLREVQRINDEQRHLILAKAIEYADRIKNDILLKQEQVLSESRVRNAVNDERFDQIFKNHDLIMKGVGEMKLMESEVLKRSGPGRKNNGNAN